MNEKKYDLLMEDKVAWLHITIYHQMCDMNREYVIVNTGTGVI